MKSYFRNPSPILIVVGFVFVLLWNGCESRILPGIMETAADIATPRFTLDVEKSGNGTVNITSAIVKQNDSTIISAGPDAEWVFSHWSVTAGSGVIFGEAEARDTAVKLTSDNATICANFVPEVYLDLTSPVGGETYRLDDAAVLIQWDHLNLDGTVDIDLCDTDGTPLSPIVSTNIGSGEYAWNVAVTAPAAGAYRIKITSVADSSYTDISDTIFYLSNLSVTTPSGGVYGLGGSCPIAWSSDLNMGTLRIDLMSGSSSTVVRNITTGVSVSGGSYSWTPTAVTGYTGGSYSIRITREDAGNIAAQSSSFAIIDGVTVTTPGTTDRIAGSSLPISWSGVYAGTVKVELLESGGLATTISGSTANDGSHSYTIPLDQLPDTRYAVQVTTLTTPAFTDTSGEFRILPPTPTGISASDTSSTAHVAVSWTGVSGNPFYKIYRATSSTGTYSNIKTVSGVTYYNDDSATPGTRYYYKVSSLRNGVEGNQSGWNEGVRDILTPTITSHNGNTSRVYLDWNDITGWEQYRVYRSTSTSTGYSLLGSTSSSYYYDYSATPGQRYYYKVAAYNTLTGEKLSAYVEEHRDMAQVTGLSFDNSSTGSLTLSWNSITGAVSGYRIYRREYSEVNGAWGSWAALTTKSTTSYQYYPPIRGKVYNYAVAVYNTYTGEYYWSESVYAHAKMWPPTSFSAVYSALNANMLYWYGEADATGGYEIQAYTPFGLWQTQTTVPQGTYSYKDTFSTMPGSKPTSYRIRCVYDSYWDDYSGSLVIYNTTSDWVTTSAP